MPVRHRDAHERYRWGGTFFVLVLLLTGTADAVAKGPNTYTERPEQPGLVHGDEPQRIDRAGFAIRCGERWSRLRVFVCLSGPDSTFQLRVRGADRRSEFDLRIRDGDGAGPEVLEVPVRRSETTRRWTVRAPREPGIFPLTIVRAGTADSVRIQLVVWRPRSEMKGEYLNGYRIGAYPDRRLNGRAIYRAPPGFAEVTAENRTTRLTPHFRIEQFLCKQESGYPKYLVIDPALLLRLEHLLEVLRERGFELSTLHVMSGYRTPFYNEAIGNVPYSRHQWGGAADVFVDADEDGYMDDLNADGAIDEADAEWLRRLIPTLGPTPADETFRGGLSAYGSTSAHGPFVHVDVRGHRARW